jgi:transposase
MPKPCPAEFRLRAAALVRVRNPITQASYELGISAAALHNWIHQDRIAQGEIPGVTSRESIELAWGKETDPGT